MTKGRDTFIAQGHPAQDMLPDFVFAPEFTYPDDLNIAVEMLDKKVANGLGDKVLFITENETWTYGDLLAKSNQVANWLVGQTDFMIGDRVLLRSSNNPMLVACWFGVIKAGGVVVTTMPMLRQKDINMICEDTDCRYLLCDYRYAGEVDGLPHISDDKIFLFNGSGQAVDDESSDYLNRAIATQSPDFETVITGRDSIMLLGPTSGTTGRPKITMHHHGDCLSICKGFADYSLTVTQDDIFIGSPPIGFTFGLGALVLFPMYYGASTVLLDAPAPDAMLSAIEKHKVTICFTAPTAWRVLASMAGDYNVQSLHTGVTAGEALSPKVANHVKTHLGLVLIDGIGSTEMLHIFLGRDGNTPENGSLGKAIGGYEAKIIDVDGNDVAVGETGFLAVRGPTGCRYLNNPTAQQKHVVNGWNKTGDMFYQDENGYFYCLGRGDDIIVTSGYNVSPIEVENVLAQHADIQQVVVAGTPDEERGNVITAFVVLKDGVTGDDAKIKEIQDWFKREATPYKYPRLIKFVTEIPRTNTGKVQRYKLKELL